MAKLNISHHERVDGHPHRWRVFLHGNDEPVHVELPHEEREKIDMSDDQIHDLLPSALERCAEENPPETWDAPVRVMQTHFIA
jgi:hypothetical protein